MTQPSPATLFSRREALNCTARLSTALLLSAALPAVARAQVGTRSPPKQPSPEFLAAPAPVAITVNARPLPSFDLRDRSHVQFGSLRFRSGLILTSSFRGFGGLSSLRLDPKGERFVTASDKGTWFTGRIVYAGKEMAGLADVEAAPMLAADGTTLASRGWFDTESIALDNGIAYVGIERVNQIVKFDFGRDGVRARGEAIAVPPRVRKLPFNKGLEALVVVPKGRPLAGTLVAFSERGLDSSGNNLAFLIGGRSPGEFSVRRTEDFDISDAAILPSGDILLLERKFSLAAGVGIRIRRIALASVMPGALVDGPAIFNADLGEEIDNLEGIDAFVDGDGDTVLTLVSDDNFSMLQRTLLLQFTLVE